MATPNCEAVLVVEDQRDLRELVVEILQEEGFRVYEAANGREALQVLREMPQPALVLADLMMPVMDGSSLIAALREDDQFATLPVVIVSAVNAQLPQGTRHVKKPIDLDDLTQIVSELCLRRA
jgi:CheY-like chemotaxis protein